MENAKITIFWWEKLHFLVYILWVIHVFNTAFWKCVKGYAIYHPHKTHNLSLPTNCNHRKEKVIKVVINICLLHVILQCHMWLMLIQAAHVCSATVILNSMTKRDSQLMHKCKKNALFFWCVPVQLHSSQSTDHIKSIRYLFCIQEEHKIPTLYKILTAQLAIPDTTIIRGFYRVNIWCKSWQRGQWCYLSEVYNLCNQRIF